MMWAGGPGGLFSKKSIIIEMSEPSGMPKTTCNTLVHEVVCIHHHHLASLFNHPPPPPSTTTLPMTTTTINEQLPLPTTTITSKWQQAPHKAQDHHQQTQ